MSASLVGSEMCIRDRNKMVRRRAERRRGLAVLHLRHHAHGSRVHGGEAVSYTHLTLPTICSV
eukprot:9878934-Alexandrium_andersonii.AAC.1